MTAEPAPLPDHWQPGEGAQNRASGGARGAEPPVGRHTRSRPEAGSPSAGQMKDALGHFATGVTVVTGMAPDERPVGFACQSFASVSLDPPLVLFCADHRGRSWPLLRGAGRFTVNVLGHDQRDLVQRFGSPAGRRFDGLDWTSAEVGGPRLPGVLMRVHCQVQEVHVAGDHDVVVGRVLAIDEPGSGRPMVYYRSQFTVTEDHGSQASAEAGPEPLDDYWG